MKLPRRLGKDTTPWDLLQPFDAERFGEVIFNREEQERWSKALFLGGLPYMWRRAVHMLDIIYDLLELRDGDNVFLIGESLESCGFIEDLEERIGKNGKLTAHDIQEDCRNAFLQNQRGAGGQRGTFRYNYTSDIPDETYDVVLNLQAVQHADDWREAGKELIRIMKPGRRLVMAEITLGGPEQAFKVSQDLHIEHVIHKVMAHICGNIEEFPYYSPAELHQAFEGLLVDQGDMEWRGLEVFWGRKP